MAASPEEQLILQIAMATFPGLEFEVDLEANAVRLMLVLRVVAKQARNAHEINADVADRHGLECQVGDELLFQVFYLASDEWRASEQNQMFGEIFDFEEAYRQAEPIRMRKVPGATPVPY